MVDNGIIIMYNSIRKEIISMIRLFNQSHVRKISTLDARWDFVTDKENCGI